MGAIDETYTSVELQGHVVAGSESQRCLIVEFHVSIVVNFIKLVYTNCVT